MTARPIAIGADSWLEPGSVVVISGPPTEANPVRRWLAFAAIGEALATQRRAVIVSNEITVDERTDHLHRLTGIPISLVRGAIDFARPAARWWHAPAPWAAQRAVEGLGFTRQEWRALGPSVAFVDCPGDPHPRLWAEVADLLASASRGDAEPTTWIVATGQPHIEGAHVLEARVRLSRNSKGFFVDEYLDREGELVEKTTTGTAPRLAAEIITPSSEVLELWMSCSDDGRRRLWIDG